MEQLQMLLGEEGKVLAAFVKLAAGTVMFLAFCAFMICAVRLFQKITGDE